MRVEVVTDGDLRRRIRLLYYFCAPGALLSLVGAVPGLQRGHTDEVLGMLAITAVLLLAPQALKLKVGRRQHVHFFDEHGVTLRNGRTFRWESLREVIERKRGRPPMHNHYELHFAEGIAYVPDLLAANYEEVRHIIDELVAGRNPLRPAS